MTYEPIPTNDDDVIDSRDVIARIESLTAMLDDEDTPNDERKDLVTELDALISFAQEAADYSEDWTYGAVCVRESYFTDYARELAEDTMPYPRPKVLNEWPWRHIDWDAAADALKEDYTAVTFDGVTYYVR